MFAFLAAVCHAVVCSVCMSRIAEKKLWLKPGLPRLFFIIEKAIFSCQSSYRFMNTIYKPPNSLLIMLSGINLSVSKPILFTYHLH